MVATEATLGKRMGWLPLGKAHLHVKMVSAASGIAFTLGNGIPLLAEVHLQP